jgi:hypothetical protein
MCAVLVLESTHKNIGFLGFFVTSGSIQAISYLLYEINVDKFVENSKNI